MQRKIWIYIMHIKRRFTKYLFIAQSLVLCWNPSSKLFIWNGWKFLFSFIYRLEWYI